MAILDRECKCATLLCGLDMTLNCCRSDLILKSCIDCISAKVRCRMFNLGVDIGYRVEACNNAKNYFMFLIRYLGVAMNSVCCVLTRSWYIKIALSLCKPI